MVCKVEAQRHSIVKVGDGRGFIVKGNDPRYKGFGERFIITAVHCLPSMPACDLMRYTEDATFADLIGAIDGAATIWTECVFADAVSDLAILDNPDDQELFEKAELYEEFTQAATPIRIREGRAGERVWVLGLDGDFKAGVLAWVGLGTITVKGLADAIKPGTSGSPILGDDGFAISLCQIGTDGGIVDDCISVNLPACLPRWFSAKRKRRDPYGLQS